MFGNKINCYHLQLQVKFVRLSLTAVVSIKTNLKYGNARFYANKVDDLLQRILHGWYIDRLCKVDIHTLSMYRENEACLFSRDKMQGAKFKDPIQATDKRVIITGTTSGIGTKTAEELAKRGAHVYMANRNMRKCEDVRDEIILASKNRNVHCMECDLSSLESIREFVKE